MPTTATLEWLLSLFHNLQASLFTVGQYEVASYNNNLFCWLGQKQQDLASKVFILAMWLDWMLTTYKGFGSGAAPFYHLFNCLGNLGYQ